MYFFLVLLLFLKFCSAEYVLENEFSLYPFPVGGEVVFSPDCTKVAVFGSSHGYNHIHVSKNIIIWDLETGRQRCILSGHDEKIRCCAFSSDGKELVSGDHAGCIKYWNTDDGSCCKTYHIEKPISALAIQENELSKGILVGTDYAGLYFYDLNNDLYHSLYDNRHCGKIRKIICFNAGRYFLSLSSASGCLIKVLNGHDEIKKNEAIWINFDHLLENRVCVADFCEKDGLLLLGRANGILEWFSLIKPIAKNTFFPRAFYKKPVTAVAFSSDSNYFFSCWHDSNVLIFDCLGRYIDKIETSCFYVKALKERVDGKVLLVSSFGNVRCYKKKDKALDEETLSSRSVGYNDVQNNQADDKNFDSLASAFESAVAVNEGNDVDNYTFLCHKLKQQWFFKPFDYNHYYSVIAAYTHSSGCLVTADFHGIIKLWDVHNQICRDTLFVHKHQNDLGSVALAELSSGLLVTVSSSGIIKIWDSIAGQCLSAITIPARYFSANIMAIVLPDDEIVYAVDNEINIIKNNIIRHTIILEWVKEPHYFLENGQLRKREGEKDSITALAILSDTIILAGSKSGKIFLYKSETGDIIKSFSASQYGIKSLIAYSDTVVIFSTDDNYIKFFDVQSERLLKEVQSPSFNNSLILRNSDCLSWIASDFSYIMQVSSGKIEKIENKKISSVIVNSKNNLIVQIKNEYKNNVVLIDHNTGKEIPLSECWSYDSFKSVLLAPNNKIIVTVSHNILRVYDQLTGKILSEWKEPNTFISCLAIGTDDTIFVGLGNGDIKQLNQSAELLYSYMSEEHASFIHSAISKICVLSDGQIVAGNTGGGLFVWDPRCSQPRLKIQAHSDGVAGLIGSFNNQVASWGYKNEVCVWDTVSGKCLEKKWYDRAHSLPKFNDTGSLIVDFKFRQCFKLNFSCTPLDHTLSEVLRNNYILSSSAEHHSKFGIWMPFEDFIGQLPSDEIALIDKFIQNPLLSYHQLSPSEQRLYGRLPYINQLVRKIKEWLS